LTSLQFLTSFLTGSSPWFSEGAALEISQGGYPHCNKLRSAN